MQQAAEGELAQPWRRQAELLSHLDRAQRDATRVLLGRDVLGRERHQQRAHVRAEEGLLVAHELDRAEVARERPRLGAATAEVDRHGDRDARDPDQLEPVREPPAEVRVVLDQRRDEGRAEPDDADGDRQVARAAGEQERPQRASREDAEEEEAGDEQGVGLGGCVAPARSARATGGRSRRARARGRSRPRRRGAQSSGRTALGRPTAGRAERARIAPPIGSVRPPLSATTPYASTEIPGVVSPCRRSSDAITENATPTRTARPSPARAPAMVRVKAATVARPAPIDTHATCIQPPRSTVRSPTKTSTAIGPRATAAASASK